MNREAAADTPIRVYRCRIPACGDSEHLLSGLRKIPSCLHEDITRFKRVQDQLARVVARRLVSKLLDDSGLGQFSDLCNWRKDSRGRPFISESNADISISHSESWVVAGLSISSRIGVDVEVYRTMELDSIRPYLSSAELEILAKTSDPHREAVRFWSRREAILKADGRGLLAPEDVIRDVANMEQPSGGRWRIESFDIDQACIYLATDQYAAPILHSDWDFMELL